MQEAKWLSEEALQIAKERREVKSKGKGERYIQLNAELQRKARRDEKVFFQLCSFHMLIRLCSKSFKLGFSST